MIDLFTAFLLARKVGQIKKATKQIVLNGFLGYGVPTGIDIYYLNN